MNWNWDSYDKQNWITGWPEQYEQRSHLFSEKRQHTGCFTVLLGSCFIDNKLMRSDQSIISMLSYCKVNEFISTVIPFQIIQQKNFNNIHGLIFIKFLSYVPFAILMKRVKFYFGIFNTFRVVNF